MTKKRIGFQRTHGGPTRSVLVGLGYRMKQRRTALGLSLRDLDALTAKRGHRVAYSHLSNIENETDGRGGLGPIRLRAIADALDVSADWLLLLTDDPTPSRRTRRRRLP